VSQKGIKIFLAITARTARKIKIKPARGRRQHSLSLPQAKQMDSKASNTGTRKNHNNNRHRNTPKAKDEYKRSFDALVDATSAINCHRHDHRKSTTRTTFTISAEPTPECDILMGTSRVTIATWQASFGNYQRERQLYNLQYNTEYDPPLRRWVDKSVWRLISADLLHVDEATDPIKGEPPNDTAVGNLLLQRGRYKAGEGSKFGAYRFTWVRQMFTALKWPKVEHETHTQLLDRFLTSWYDLADKVRPQMMPKEKHLCKWMLQAVEPEELRKNITNRMWDGLAPDVIHTPQNAESKEWRKEARVRVKYMSRLLREHVNYRDDMIEYERMRTLMNGLSTRTSNPAPTRETRQTSRPKCVVKGCNNLVNNKRRGCAYHKTCKQHAHVCPQ